MEGLCHTKTYSVHKSSMVGGIISCFKSKYRQKYNQYKAFIKVFYKKAGQKRGRNHFKSFLPEINIPLKFSNP